MRPLPEGEMEPQTPSEVSVGVRVGRYRFVLVSLLLLMMLISSADRVNLSLLLVDIDFLRTMGIEDDHTAQGALMSAFVLAYGLGNVFFGPVVDWLGARRIMLGMLVLWSGLAAFMGSVSSFGLMMAGRSIRGASEGPIFPTMNRFVRTWFPAQERGRANAIWLMGPSLGMAATVPVLAMVIPTFGWRAAFFGVAGMSLLVGLPVAYFTLDDRPQQSRWVGAAEAEHIMRGTEPDAAMGARRWRDARLFIGDYHYWLLVIYHLASLAILWGLVTWLPKYLVEARGMQMGQSGLLAAMPYLVSSGSTLFFGSLSDRFKRRAPFCALQMIGVAAAVYAAASVSSAVASAVLLAVAFAFWGMGAAVTHTLVQRIVPASVISTGSGIDNGVSNLGAAVCPVLIGYLIGATGSYFAGLMVLVAMGAIGGLFMIVLSVQKY